jgi:hypothetical protein
MRGSRLKSRKSFSRCLTSMPSWVVMSVKPGDGRRETGDGGWVLAVRAGCWLTLAVER